MQGTARPADPDRTNACSPERGIDGVSMRELNMAAGRERVRAASRITRHEGENRCSSLGHRVPEIEARRQAMLAEMKAAVVVCPILASAPVPW